MIVYGLNRKGAPVLLEQTTEALDDILERVRLMLCARDEGDREAAQQLAARVVASAERLYWTQRTDLEELEIKEDAR